MASPVADVVAALADAFGPGVEVERAILLHVRAAQTHALTVNAGEVRFATDTGPVATIERVIPDVKLPDVGSIDRGDEVNCRERFSVRTRQHMGDIYDIL